MIYLAAIKGNLPALIRKVKKCTAWLGFLWNLLASTPFSLFAHFPESLFSYINLPSLDRVQNFRILSQFSYAITLEAPWLHLLLQAAPPPLLSSQNLSAQSGLPLLLAPSIPTLRWPTTMMAKTAAPSLAPGILLLISLQVICYVVFVCCTSLTMPANSLFRWRETGGNLESSI